MISFGADNAAAPFSLNEISRPLIAPGASLHYATTTLSKAVIAAISVNNLEG
jgi:hypothetical protein